MDGFADILNLVDSEASPARVADLLPRDDLQKLYQQPTVAQVSEEVVNMMASLWGRRGGAVGGRREDGEGKRVSEKRKKDRV